ncbi:16S rRNA (guanine(966)-N(2))-methyltransferase RsmD [Microbulbifer guangxiensis]|uniref:16S rRNA (guanine(966)-N(2))-methyltransferase RsmD n=1 Tax=Microbulbifer guangxiensis TaxID=2904249 RepID=UPI001F00F2ED|nr:16S rRNA (guanine(966)-N(2))-methyltransferase RsmD [Microbulbifer guangxiensis]
MSRSRARKPAHRPSTPGLSQLRIIGGEWRGRKLQFAPVEGLRPTGDRLRETLFNWLQFRVPGARCLDLFAGSGALGLEALSRGAAAVDFVELNRLAAQTLREQLQLLQCERGRVHNCSAAQFLQGAGGNYDIAFVDPPFAGDLWTETLAGLVPQLSPRALVYVEAPKTTALEVPPSWQLLKEKRAGQVCMRLLQVGEPGGSD